MGNENIAGKTAIAVAEPRKPAAKAKAEDATAPSPAPEPAEFDQTLDEFCAQLSAGDRRVELIGAFHAVERRAGRVKDLPSAYAARFTAFVNAPA